MITLSGEADLTKLKKITYLKIPFGANSFLLKQTPFQMGFDCQNHRDLSSLLSCLTELESF